MDIEQIKKILVVGSGTMGHGIAEVFALSGYEVYLSDISQDIVNSGMQKIKWSLEKFHEKGRLKENVDHIMARIKPIVGLSEQVKDVDFAIEAAVERLDLKRQIFQSLDQTLKEEAILATNTSSLPITLIARSTKREDKVIGMHFFNPPVLMSLVEVMKGEKTTDQTAKIVYELAKRIGKQPVMINKDVPGYLVNRLLFGIFNGSCIIVEKGLASFTEVDAAARYKLGFPMGVFELMDYTGIDVVYLINEGWKQLGIELPGCSLIDEKFKMKEFGVKSGKGFYAYPSPGKYSKPDIPIELKDKVDPSLIIAGAVNEAARLLRNGVSSKEDIDLSVELGLGLPKGILRYADEIGIDNVVNAISKLRIESNNEFYNVDALLMQMMGSNKLGVKTGEGFYIYNKVEEKKYKNVLLRIEPPLAWIILDRPEMLNAITQELVEEVNKALDELETDNRVRTLILTGNGRSFSAGADIASFLNLKPIDIIRYRTLRELASKISLYTKPILAAINGYALGGGLELAMACDIRIASETAQLGQPEINLGIIPGAGGTQRLPKLVGKGKAKMLIYTGEIISAKQAYEIGLVDLVVPPEKFEEEVKRVATKIAEKSPSSLIAAKLAIEMGNETNIWDGMLIEGALFGLLLTTNDVKEGIKAFLEKRKPKFVGE
ncbi:3-hydroxyacyl-CoA dehydrogenase/enoyl-CoA hydratase family protein [Acidianus sp. RZ1]|uniref:3-hydroxyacyl-CoA dehydrogenase/enoyl-CoA hydratase family protein n=1 Tax=Acidianus sp. RZ1 TaxID=1540082 RepID=UPI001491D6A4|nr:enoyl-CoA hydratase-related protein [Acidianus sp. RZ1]NON62747.1 3-hydroxyacyl-CoA dehydrogenase [Acidianus sp. RZ1]